jgi:hypothetical protein
MEHVLELIKKFKRNNLSHMERIKRDAQLYSVENMNEFVVLLKPECFKIRIDKEFTKLMDYINNMFNKYEVQVIGASIFNGDHARKYSLIESEYYMLNKGARYGYLYLPTTYQRDIRLQYDDCEVIGAYNFILTNKHGITSTELEQKTSTSPSDKIGNGTYILSLEYGENKYAVINAFHPEQLEHFYKKENITTAILCRSHTEYNTLSENMVGHYVPSNSKPDSIRYYMYKNQKEMGIQINNFFNGIHISPSPLEGIFGYYRYSSFFRKSLLTTYLGSELSALGLSCGKICSFIQNPLITHQNETVDLFGMCENKDTEDIIKIIKEHL